MKIKKILAAVAAAAVAISTMALNAFAADIWTGSNDVDWNTNAIRLEGSLFADAKGGDTVEITYTANKDGACLKIVSNTDGWPALDSVTEKDATYGTVGVTDSGTFSFAISAEDLATVQGSGMVIQGDGTTVTKVAVNAAAEEAAPAEETAPAEEEAAAPEEEAAEAEEAEAEDVDVESEEEADEPETEAEPVAETEEAPAVADAQTGSEAPKTGNTAAASMIAVMAAAGVAAVVSKKRK